MNANIAQSIGCRQHQEDSYGVKFYPDGVLAVVCDGMGGHQHGTMASRVAVQAFTDDFSASCTGDLPVVARLQRALDAANAAVKCAFCGVGGYGGTTLVAAYVSSGLMWWVSVGDSPLLLWRGGRLLRLNADHSLRAVYMEYVQTGVLSYEEAMSQGHLLRSALTGDKIAMVDVSSAPHPLLPGDRLILASDGVDDVLLPRVLSAEVKNMLDSRAKPLSSQIIAACEALNDPAADNATAVCLDWEWDEATSIY